MIHTHWPVVKAKPWQLSASLKDKLKNTSYKERSPSEATPSSVNQEIARRYGTGPYITVSQQPTACPSLSLYNGHGRQVIASYTIKLWDLCK